MASAFIAVFIVSMLTKPVNRFLPACNRVSAAADVDCNLIVFTTELHLHRSSHIGDGARTSPHARLRLLTSSNIHIIFRAFVADLPTLGATRGGAFAPTAAHDCLLTEYRPRSVAVARHAQCCRSGYKRPAHCPSARPLLLAEKSTSAESSEGG